MKKIKLTAIIASAALVLTGTLAAFTAYAKSGDSSTTTTAAVAASQNDEKIIIMESNYVGYMVKASQVDKIVEDTMAEGKGDSVITAVLNEGQRYYDEQTGYTFCIRRKPGTENSTFELPEKVTVYDATGFSYHQMAYQLNADDFEDYEIVTTGYGDFKLRHAS